MKSFQKLHYVCVCTILFILITTSSYGQGKILHIGSGQQYSDFQSAATAAKPGDTIQFHAGTHSGGAFVANLQGTAKQWITIRNAPGTTAIISGGANAVQLTDPAYLIWEGLTFQQQTGNGFNTDDGGSYATPAHHIIFRNCTFQDIAATGNNDLLKLSGLDTFEISNCTFKNGAAGGSGIDMVGCHHGIIQKNIFENQGSNAIQAKGGAQFIRIERNLFKNCGERALNLGGSTGLQFFRPADAPFEAANLLVYSNIFIGSIAPIAFVGCVESQVINNTIFKPEKWVVRILQETVDPLKFLPCSNNSFRNNIIYLDSKVSTETNIGPNTAPETFTYSNNLWYHSTNTNWGGPYTPVPDMNALIQQNPQFQNINLFQFQIGSNSPAKAKGFFVSDPVKDYAGNGFNTPRSIGAYEANPLSSTNNPLDLGQLKFWPNPNPGHGFLEFYLQEETQLQIDFIHLLGSVETIAPPRIFSAGLHRIPVELLNDAHSGFIKIQAGLNQMIIPVMMIE